MKKSYYLKYGSNKSKEEINKFYDTKWDINCSEHDSSYFGVYFSYSGLYADKLTITDNYIALSKEYLDEKNKKFKSLIKVSFIEGKNKDKLSRYKFMKNIINQADIFTLIIDNCIEEEVVN